MIHVDDNEPVQIRPDPDKLFLYHRQQLSACSTANSRPTGALHAPAAAAPCWPRTGSAGSCAATCCAASATTCCRPPHAAWRALAGDTAEASLPRAGPARAWGAGVAGPRSRHRWPCWPCSPPASCRRQARSPGRRRPPLVAGRTDGPGRPVPCRSGTGSTPSPMPRRRRRRRGPGRVPEAGAMLAASAAALAERHAAPPSACPRSRRQWRAARAQSLHRRRRRRRRSRRTGHVAGCRAVRRAVRGDVPPSDAIGGAAWHFRCCRRPAAMPFPAVAGLRERVFSRSCPRRRRCCAGPRPTTWPGARRGRTPALSANVHDVGAARMAASQRGRWITSPSSTDRTRTCPMKTPVSAFA